MKVEVRINGAAGEVLAVDPQPGRWFEAAITLPPGLPPRARVEFVALDGETVLYHAWTVERRAD